MKKNYIIGSIFIVLGILLDQIVKIIVRVNMPVGESITIINHFFCISHVENTGAAWGGFSGFTIVLTILSIGMLGFFIYLYRNIDFKNKKIYSVSLVLVISGTIGNLIDRLFFQHVTDFLDFYIFGYDYPVFNIADILLVVGFGFLIVYLIFFSEKKEEQLENTSNEETNEETSNEVEEITKEETINEDTNIDDSNEIKEDTNGTD